MTLPVANHYKPDALIRGLAARQIDLLLISMTFVWGANFSILKIAFHTLSPLAFNVLRFLIATLLFIGILLWQRQPVRIARADVWKVVTLGVIGHSVYQVFFIEGLAHTTAANASLLMATVPIFVALFSALLHIEYVTLRRWVGIILSFVGIALVTRGNGQSLQLGASHLLGDLLVLGAAMMWAVYTVMSKPLLTRYSPLHLTSVSMIPGTAVLALFGSSAILAQHWSSVKPVAWAGLAYSAIFAIVLAYLIWFTGVQRVGNARTAVYSNVIPVVASLLAWAVLHEPFGVWQAIGGAIILTGVILTQRNSRL